MAQCGTKRNFLSFENDFCKSSISYTIVQKSKLRLDFTEFLIKHHERKFLKIPRSEERKIIPRRLVLQSFRFEVDAEAARREDRPHLAFLDY